MIQIKKIDHLVLTTSKVEPFLSFYKKLGFVVKHTTNRYELFLEDFKINVHLLGNELEPHAQNVTTGSADLCFEVCQDIEILVSYLSENDIQIELGPIARTGVKGKMTSIYIRDPEGNLIELSSYAHV